MYSLQPSALHEASVRLARLVCDVTEKNTEDQESARMWKHSRGHLVAGTGTTNLISIKALSL